MTLVYQGAESIILDVWLDAVFVADTGPGGVATLATGGWHVEVAPRKASPPYIVWQHQVPPIDALTATDASVAVAGEVLIKVVVGGRSYLPAVPILARITALMTRAQADIPNGRILSVTRKGASGRPRARTMSTIARSATSLTTRFRPCKEASYGR